MSQVVYKIKNLFFHCLIFFFLNKFDRGLYIYSLVGFLPVSRDSHKKKIIVSFFLNFLTVYDRDQGQLLFVFFFSVI